MTIETFEIKSPKGRNVVRTYSNGEVSEADIRAHLPRLGKGGQYFGWPQLAVSGPNTKLSVGARKAIAELRDNESTARVALVLASTVTRVMVGFITRMMPSQQNTRTFATEEEGLAWLDEG